MANTFSSGYQVALSDIAGIIERGGSLAEVAEWVTTNSEALRRTNTLVETAEQTMAQAARHLELAATAQDSRPAPVRFAPLGRTTARELTATVVSDPTVPNWRPIRYTGPQSAPGMPVTRVSVSNGMQVWVRAYGSWRGGVVRSYKSRSNIPVEFRMAYGGTKLRNFHPEDVKRPS